MKNLSTLTFGLFLLAGLIPQQADAQSIVGKWKRTGLVIVNTSGVKQDVDKMMRQAMPCMKDIVYTFMSNGTLVTDATTCAATQRKLIESMNAKSRWSMTGNKITASVTDKSVPPSVHTVSFSGNSMTWQFNFADNPRMPNPTKAKSMTTVYQRL
jgi:Lipocalin-like domain